MSPDEQEALSRKHSNSVYQILLLESKRWAVYRNFQLLSTHDTFTEVEAVVSVFVPQSVQYRPTKKQTADDLLAELDL